MKNMNKYHKVSFGCAAVLLILIIIQIVFVLLPVFGALNNINEADRVLSRAGLISNVVNALMILVLIAMVASAVIGSKEGQKKVRRVKRKSIL